MLNIRRSSETTREWNAVRKMVKKRKKEGGIQKERGFDIERKITECRKKGNGRQRGKALKEDGFHRIQM
jgi:hypothetical protein